MSWIGLDGYPRAYPETLMKALQAVPGAEHVAAEDLDTYARMLARVDRDGYGEELPRARPASAAASDLELEALHDLCLRLAAHIEKNMHQPAISAFQREAGTSIFDLAHLCAVAAEAARHAYGSTEAPRRAAGRPPDIAAPAVTELAADIFEKITGAKAKYTTDPDTSEVRGDWCDFLGRVFAALCINASAASHVKAHRKSKNALRNG